MALRLAKYNTEVYAGGEIAPPLQVDKSQLPQLLAADRKRKDNAKLAADKARRESAEKYYQFVQTQSDEIDAIDNKVIEERRNTLFSEALKKQSAGIELMQDADQMNNTTKYLDAREASATRKQLRSDIPKNFNDVYIKRDQYIPYATESLNNTPLENVSSWVAPNATPSMFKTFDYLNDLTKDLKNQKKGGSYISTTASQLGETITDWAEITNLPADKIPMFVDLAYENNDTFKMVADGVGAEKALEYREKLKSEGKTDQEIDAIMKVPNQEWNGEMITMEEKFTKDAVKEMVDPFITSSKESSKKIVKEGEGASSAKKEIKDRFNPPGSFKTLGRGMEVPTLSTVSSWAKSGGKGTKTVDYRYAYNYEFDRDLEPMEVKVDYARTMFDQKSYKQLSEALGVEKKELFQYMKFKPLSLYAVPRGKNGNDLAVVGEGDLAEVAARTKESTADLNKRVYGVFVFDKETYAKEKWNGMTDEEKEEYGLISEYIKTIKAPETQASVDFNDVKNNLVDFGVKDEDEFYRIMKEKDDKYRNKFTMSLTGQSNNEGLDY